MFFNYADIAHFQNTLPDYAKQVVTHTIERIGNPDFPCYFAKKVLPKKSLYFAFTQPGSNREAMFEQALQALSAYAVIEQNPDPYRVLVLSMHWPTQSWQEDNDLLWNFVRYLSQHDPAPWPEAIPQTTSDAGWSFAFMGMPWFFNVNSHNYLHRNSRNVTGMYSLIIQRTDSFEKLLCAERSDDKREAMRHTIRKEIRGRVAAYDGQSVSPALAGEPDNLQHLEWIQYHIPDLNTEKPQAKCPFQHH
jgi:uncharacterized protein